jgi:hypothetical protein
MNGRDELNDVMEASEGFDELCDFSSSVLLILTLRQKTWMVPLLLETANH